MRESNFNNVVVPARKASSYRYVNNVVVPARKFTSNHYFNQIVLLSKAIFCAGLAQKFDSNGDFVYAPRIVPSFCAGT